MEVSRDGFLNCNYRNCSGLKCAAGCLIRSEDYTEDLEGMSWHKALRILPGLV